MFLPNFGRYSGPLRKRKKSYASAADNTLALRRPIKRRFLLPIILILQLDFATLRIPGHRGHPFRLIVGSDSD